MTHNPESFARVLRGAQEQGLVRLKRRGRRFIHWSLTLTPKGEAMLTIGEEAEADWDRQHPGDDA